MGNQTSQEVRYADKLENDVVIKWKKLLDSSDPYPGRDGHCASNVGGKLYIFGGIVPQRDHTSENIESNELLVFDLDAKSWNLVDVKGDIPCPRSGATMASVGNKLFLFGGLSRETGWLDTVHEFDTATNTWHLVETNGTPPSPRDKLASAVIGSLIYIFGGFGPQGTELDELEGSEDEDGDEVPEDQEGAQFGWFNDLFVYDTETKTFSSPMQMNLGCPTPRAAHGMCSVGKYLVIFGGRDSEGRKNDLYVYNTENRKWMTDLVVHGCPPEPRSFHTVTAVGDRVVVVGGRGVSDQHFQDFHIFDTNNRHWLQPKTEGAIPEGRGVHTATVVRNQLIVFGGSAQYSQETLQCSQYFNDVYAVDTACITTGSGHVPASDVLRESVNQSATSSVSADTKQHPESESVSPSDRKRVSSESKNGSMESDQSPSKRAKLGSDDKAAS